MLIQPVHIMQRLIRIGACDAQRDGGAQRDNHRDRKTCGHQKPAHAHGALGISKCRRWAALLGDGFSLDECASFEGRNITRSDCHML